MDLLFAILVVAFFAGQLAASFAVRYANRIAWACAFVASLLWFIGRVP